MLSKVKRGAAAGLVGLATTLASASAMAAWNELNLPVGVTSISRDAYDIHMLMLWICVIMGIIVFGAMFVSIVLHRKAAGHKPAQFHHSTLAEIAWTVIPIVILVGFAIPATFGLIRMEDTSESELTLKVTGYQWLWKYEYVEDGVTFYSKLADSSRAAIYEDPWEVDNYLLEVDKPVVLPVGKKVRLLLTADDVIHAWWVPAFGMKKDAIPGYVNEMWFNIEEPGVYRGQCAELCGKDHGFMPIVVEAKSEAEYKQWVAAYKAEQKTRLAAAPTQSQ
jgi:cytochrome c oxidase subunit 2